MNDHYLSGPDPLPGRPYLDALKGLAIMAVVAAHCHPHVPDLPRWFKTIVYQGGMGVQLFFVVSALSLFLSADIRRAFLSPQILRPTVVD